MFLTSTEMGKGCNVGGLFMVGSPRYKPLNLDILYYPFYFSINSKNGVMQNFHYGGYNYSFSHNLKKGRRHKFPLEKQKE